MRDYQVGFMISEVGIEIKKNKGINMEKINIVGCGPGNRSYLTEKAEKVVQESDYVLGSERLVKLFRQGDYSYIKCRPYPSETIQKIEKYIKEGEVSVLVTGDPSIFSLAYFIVEYFGREKCNIIPGISSLQVACNRLGINFSGMKLVSVHGRIPKIGSEELQSYNKIALFCGTKQGECWVANLVNNLNKKFEVWYCADLTFPEETVKKIDIRDLIDCETKRKTIIILLSPEETNGK